MQGTFYYSEVIVIKTIIFSLNDTQHLIFLLNIEIKFMAPMTLNMPCQEWQ